MVHIPSGPAPRQVEPGSQTEQAPPSAVFWLGPEDMRGFRFLTISIAPRPTVSGRPPPAASMAVGQFFNPKEGEREFSPHMLLLSTYSQKDIMLKEDHPLAFNLSFTTSLGLLPVKLSLKTTGCGIKKSGLPVEEAGDLENSRLCKLRCFPPVALAWDTTSGLQIFPNLYSETILVDSSPALWSSTQGSEKTTVLLLVDPHCSYKTSIALSVTAAASRFLLLYCSQIVGFSIAVVFFALMRQAHAWEFDQPIPSMLSAVELNLRMPLPFLFLAILPIGIALFLSFLMSQPFPPFISFITVSTVCYLFANGTLIILILISQLVFYLAAIIHVFIKARWQGRQGNFCFVFIHWFLNLSSGFLSFRVVRVLRVNPLLVTVLAAITLVCFVHPALGLFILLLYHALCCHNALSSFLMASFRSHAQSKESEQIGYRYGGGFNKHLPLDENCSSSPDSPRSFGDTQLEIFHHRHGLLILHFLAALMFAPSLVAWLQRIVRLSFGYLLAGYYSFLSGLALAPYRGFYAMAAIGVISFAFRIIQRRNREKGEPRANIRKHSHRH
ncbi:hypothetical protein F0562_004553 [Nyssa sinensis]|uniref:Uncharacterized protein n=1 Tax=Nyssa sinensis TaxID=561372 RepID=A0A5J5BZX4_9ASTE|nr:hypothetical protein F0562_004553 [Nyssa sinensis]